MYCYIQDQTMHYGESFLIFQMLDIQKNTQAERQKCLKLQDDRINVA